MESESKKFEQKESEGGMSFEEAHLSALASYLSGEWNPERYKQYLSKGYVGIDEAKFRVPGTDITILAGGEVEYEGKKKPHGDIWPSVTGLANDLDRLGRMIETVRNADGNVPEAVQQHFDRLKQEHDQIESAFEHGEKWEATLNRTSLEEHFSASFAPETISVKLILKDGGDRLIPKDWRVEILHDDLKLEGGVKSINETNKELIIAIDASEGDETGGIAYDGEIIFDITKGINKATISADDRGPNGGYEATFEM